ncbi:hypothetical protein TRSC58_06893 [Trypanosoma rangeli SC58]|uniref:Uncharacterized protein n=1 Tax=Trypanosoma rangeli SC58 TaxID=429131 RepID=A0A061IS18_TRYRA|nr:hypothetical protein TRSC58_06893 [Trypanosoma rangeli SC58]
MQLEPEGGSAQHCAYSSVDDIDVTREQMSSATLRDPHSGTAAPAEVQHYLTNSVSSLTKYTSPSSSSIASSKEHPAHPSVVATPLAQATMPLSNTKRRKSDNGESHDQARSNRNSWLFYSGDDEGAPDTVDLWKMPTVAPSAKNSKGGKVDSSTPTKRRLRRSSPARGSSRRPKPLVSKPDSKAVLWRRPSHERSKSKDHSGKKSRLLSSGKPTSGAEGTSLFLRRGQLLKKIAEIKEELSGIRRAKRVLEASSRTSHRSSQQGKSRRSRMDLDRLERENEHLQRLLDLGVAWAGSSDLPLRIAEEELRYALDELNREKRRQRELWTENRRSSILFTQMVRHQQPTREKVACQYREGMYNRVNLQTKVASLQEKIASTHETSNYLSKQIRQLEESMQAAGLTQMKPEEYITMQHQVKKNAEQIEKLTDSVTGMLGKVECQHFACTHSSNGATPNVNFPGRTQMEALILKLIRQVEQKESQINSLRQSFVRIGSTVPKSEGSLAKFALRKQLLSESRMGSSMLRLYSSKNMHNDGSPSPRQPNIKTAAYNVPLSKVESSLEQQQYPKGEGGGVKGGTKLSGADSKRVMANKLPVSSLLKLDESLPELPERHKSSSALFSLCASCSNSGRRLGSFHKATDNSVKKPFTLNDGMKAKGNGLSNHSGGLNGLPCTIQNSQSRLSLISFGDLDPPRAVVNNEGFRANVGGKEEEAEAVLDIKESGTKAPVWLEEY